MMRLLFVNFMTHKFKLILFTLTETAHKRSRGQRAHVMK